MPPYFADVVAPVAVLGRGSPTGVACYCHTHFPEDYWGGMFLLDWTFGRIHFVSLRRSGSTYRGESKIFAEAVGEDGFAPTAIVVHPHTGDLYVSIGGRGTRGAVYRISSPTRKRGKMLPLAGASGSLEDALERRRALDLIYRNRQQLPARAISDAIRANAGHPDRYVSQAVARLIEAVPESERAGLHPRTDHQRTTFGLATYRTDAAPVLDQAGKIVADKQAGKDLRLANVRLVQLALGDMGAKRLAGTVWEGYTPRQPPERIDRVLRDKTAGVLRAAFPSGDADLDREVARTLAVLADDNVNLLEKVARRWTAKSDPVDDIHYLIVMARLPAARSAAITACVADALLQLDQKITQRHLNRDSNWPLRMAELYAELARRDPSLNAEMLAQADFGRPDHALFARAAGFDQRRAAAVFLKKAAADPAFSWNADLVQIVARLPDAEALPVLRGLWGRAGLESAILPVLARAPAVIDRPKFVQGINSANFGTVRLCLKALQTLSGMDDGSEAMALIRALGNLPGGEKNLRNSLSERLHHVTGQDLGQDSRRWIWFSKRYPDLAARLTNPDGVDVARWEKRLAALEWSKGDAERGRSVFTKASCAMCHSGSQALGPDLAGVAGRFSRADLFTAILQPSREISPRYRSTLVETTEGKVHQGLVIYDAVDSLILQTGAATTVRLAGSQIAVRRTSATSLMPAGLLDNLQDRDIADLYAYMSAKR